MINAVAVAASTTAGAHVVWAELLGYPSWGGWVNKEV